MPIWPRALTHLLQLVSSSRRELHRTLQLRGDETRQVRVENVYNETESYKHNVKVWSEAENLAQGRPMVLPVRAGSLRRGERLLSLRLQPLALNHAVASCTVGRPTPSLQRGLPIELRRSVQNPTSCSTFFDFHSRNRQDPRQSPFSTNDDSKPCCEEVSKAHDRGRR